MTDLYSENICKYEIIDERRPEDISRIGEGLDEYALKASGVVWQPISILAYDDAKNLRGGLIISLVGDSFLLHYLWVDENLRGRNIGRDLMQKAETEAIKRNCIQINVDTFDYQAPKFYQKLGYEIIATLPNFFNNHSRIYFRKKLTRGAL